MFCFPLLCTALEVESAKRAIPLLLPCVGGSPPVFAHYHSVLVAASADELAQQRVGGDGRFILDRGDGLQQMMDPFGTHKGILAQRIVFVQLHPPGERVEQRVAKTLLKLSSKLGHSLPFTRQEVADMAGTTPETTIRVMSRLRAQGVIRSARGKTIILNEGKLKQFGEG